MNLSINSPKADAQGLSAEYWAEKYEIAMWAIRESDRLHREEVNRLKHEIIVLKSCLPDTR